MNDIFISLPKVRSIIEQLHLLLCLNDLADIFFKVSVKTCNIFLFNQFMKVLLEHILQSFNGSIL